MKVKALAFRGGQAGSSPYRLKLASVCVLALLPGRSAGESTLPKSGVADANLGPAGLPDPRLTTKEVTTMSLTTDAPERLDDVSVGWRVVTEAWNSQNAWCLHRIKFIHKSGRVLDPIHDDSCQVISTSDGLFNTNFLVRNAFSDNSHPGCVASDKTGLKGLGFICREQQDIKEIQIWQESDNSARKATVQLLHRGRWQTVYETPHLLTSRLQTVWQKASCDGVCNGRSNKEVEANNLPLVCAHTQCSTDECCDACDPPPWASFTANRGKACPGADATCIDGNKARATFHDAWTACGAEKDCAYVMRDVDGRYYLRRVNDPDLNKKGTYLIEVSCQVCSVPAVEKFILVAKDCFQNTCLLSGDTGYATFKEAWKHCGNHIDCAFIQRKIDAGKTTYHLRRATDPDKANAKPMLMPWSCKVASSLPPAPSFTLKGKACPKNKCLVSATYGRRLDDTSTELPFDSFDEAWKACGITSECAFVLQKPSPGGKYYLRRANDPDSTDAANAGMMMRWSYEVCSASPEESDVLKFNAKDCKDSKCLDGIAGTTTEATGAQHKTFVEAWDKCSMYADCHFIYKDPTNTDRYYLRRLDDPDKGAVEADSLAPWSCKACLPPPHAARYTREGKEPASGSPWKDEFDSQATAWQTCGLYPDCDFVMRKPDTGTITKYLLRRKGDSDIASSTEKVMMPWTCKAKKSIRLWAEPTEVKLDLSGAPRLGAAAMAAHLAAGLAIAMAAAGVFIRVRGRSGRFSHSAHTPLNTAANADKEMEQIGQAAGDSEKECVAE